MHRCMQVHLEVHKPCSGTCSRQTAILVHHLECVRSVAIHVAIAIRDVTITEQDGHLWKQEEREEEMKARREKVEERRW